ncbi:ImuA family protein [Primorskyibacter sp. 2E107]|uniref:ImuA family protein n=1 Tax=Primorskyibacter sp. 2E107 TaxID=3403458 RepID=UPI003AF69B75
MRPVDPLLARRPHRPPPALTFWDEVRLPYARVHEVCGRARRTMALWIARQMTGGVFWIAPQRSGAGGMGGANGLNPDGVAPLIDPGRITFVDPRSVTDLLWCVEEVLRSGAVPLVVAELPEPPAMTPVRRLHLAAETGAGAGVCQPLGLLLTPDRGGAAGIETRWSLDPAHPPGRDLWRLERLRARMLPPKGWWCDGAGLQAEGAGQSPALQAVALGG